MIAHVRNQGNADRSVVATFDLSKEIAAGIQDAIVDIAIDPRPFVQAYQSVQALVNDLRFGVLAPDHIASGIGIVNAGDLDVAVSFAGRPR